MKQDIKLEIVDDKVKVTSPFNAEFVAKCRNFRGKFNKAEGAWYFDDSIIDYVRDAMIEIYGTTGEQPYENCTLLIKNWTGYGNREAVTLFGRTIARAFGRDSGAKLGEDIIFISGSYDSGGSVKNWRSEVDDGTFEIQNFPLPKTETQEVQEAIQEGWCIIKRNGKSEIKELDWNSPELYSIIGPYAMNSSVIRELDNNITTNDKMTWYLQYKGAELQAFCSLEVTQSSMTIKNFYSPIKNEDLKFDFIEMIKKKFNDSEVNKLYCFFKTDQLQKAKKAGFKETKPGKNWHRLIIEK